MQCLAQQIEQERTGTCHEVSLHPDSLIEPLSLDGFIAPMTLPGSIDTTAFLAYVNEVLIPQLWQGAIVI